MDKRKSRSPASTVCRLPSNSNEPASLKNPSLRLADSYIDCHPHYFEASVYQRWRHYRSEVELEADSGRAQSFRVTSLTERGATTNDCYTRALALLSIKYTQTSSYITHIYRLHSQLAALYIIYITPLSRDIHIYTLYSILSLILYSCLSVDIILNGCRNPAKLAFTLDALRTT